MAVDLTTGFDSALDSIVNKITAANSIYDKTLSTLNALYTSFGMSAADKSKIIAEVSAQLAVSSTNASISAAVEIAKSTVLYDMQLLEINARIASIAKDDLIKDQQMLGEMIKNGGVSFAYTYNTDGTIATKTLQNGTTKSIYEVQKEVEEARVRQVDEEIALKAALAEKDGLIKDQQELGERIKNGGVSFAYTYNTDGTIATKTLLNGTEKSIYELQKETEVANRDVAIRQKAGFDDKLKVEVMKTMGGIGQMEATSGTTQAATLLAINRSMNISLQAAGIAGFTFTEV